MFSFSAKCHNHGRLTAYLQVGFLPEPVRLQPGTEATCPGERWLQYYVQGLYFSGGPLD